MLTSSFSVGEEAGRMQLTWWYVWMSHGRVCGGHVRCVNVTWEGVDVT